MVRVLVFLLFFVSGAVGLAYEVAWTRGLLLLLGSTAGASALVLGVFVAALGLGARWGGRRAEASAHPLALYGVLEALAAVWSLVTFLLLGVLVGPYVAVAGALPESLRIVLRLGVAAVIVFPAAFLLGATLPAMVRHGVRTAEHTARTTAVLYGINTVGAVGGCLWTGFWGIEQLGVSGVLIAAASVGLLVGGAAFALGRGRGRAEAPSAGSAGSGALQTLGALALPAASTTSTSRPASAAIVAALVCGFVGLGVEVAGFRILVFFIEGFTITFAAMLGVFIAGLGLGSLVLGGPLARSRRPERVLGLVLLAEAALLGLALFVVVPALEGWMRSVKAGVYAGASSEAEITSALRLASLAGAAMLLFLPAFLLGPTFPLCVRWAQRDGLRPGEAVGSAYVGNSLGSVFAPFLLTFAIIPWTGVLGGWLMVAVSAGVAGLGLLLLPAARLARPPGVAMLALLALLVGLLSPLANIDGTRTADLVGASAVLFRHPERTLVDYATDAVTTASVVETDDGERILYTDDFAAAATGRYYRYMRMLGHLPALLAKDPKNAMVIAFGTGTTAGAVATHAAVKRLEIVEVSSAVLRLAPHFEEANRRVLEDPRVTIVRDDGRNALLLHKPDLDLITLEPLMPYSPQGLPFYTREFYELARDRLREGGVVCQWIPIHAMRADLYAAFARTFFEVFPDGTFWFFEQATALIGRKGTSQPSRETVRARVEAIRGDLAGAGFDDPWSFALGYLATGREVLAAAPPPAPGASYALRTVTDGDPFPEFHPTPRANLNTQYLPHTLAWLESLVDPSVEPTGAPWWPASFAGRRRGTQRALEARRYGAEAVHAAVFAGSASLPMAQRAALIPRMLALYDAAGQTYTEAMRDIPSDRVLRRRRLLNLRSGAMIRAAALAQRARAVTPAEGRSLLAQADRLLRSVLPPQEDDPEPAATERAQTALMLTKIQLRLGRCEKARRTLAAAATALAGVRSGVRVAAWRDALTALLARDEAAVPGWMRQAAADTPCRGAGVVPIAEPLRRFRAAVAAGGGRAAVTASRALEQAAAAQDLVPELLGELATSEPAGSAPAVRLLRARLTLRREPHLRAGPRDPLVVLAKAGPESMQLAVLAHIGRGRLLDRYEDTPIGMLGASPSAAVRQAFVRASAGTESKRLLCNTVEALMDPDADVRKEAVGVLYDRAPEELARYDAEAAEAARRAAYEAIRKRLGCGG